LQCFKALLFVLRLCSDHWPHLLRTHLTEHVVQNIRASPVAPSEAAETTLLHKAVS
jgi:hypothetical protein